MRRSWLLMIPASLTVAAGCDAIVGDFKLAAGTPGSGGNPGSGGASSSVGSTGGASTSSASSTGGSTASSASSSSSGTGGASSTASSTASSGTGGTPSTCDGGTACSDVGMCTAPQSTLCVIDACTGGCCGTAYASVGAMCHDDGGVICDGNGACVVQCDVGGTLYASGAAAPGNPCQVCTPSVSTSAFLAASDGTSCGPSASCAGGACVAHCDIGGTLVNAGTADPGNSCQACDPTKSTTAYSPTDGATCGGAFPGTCQQNVCVSSLYTGAKAFSLAVDGLNVYWTQTTADALCTTAGCAMELSLTPGSTAVALADNQNRIFSIGVAGDTVYWSNNIGSTAGVVNASDAGVVNACPTTGCANAPTTILEGVNYAGFLDLSQGRVFASGAFPALLIGVPTAGGASTTLYTGPMSGALPEKVYVAGSTVYFAVDSSILAYPIAGGAQVVLASGLDNPGAITASSGSVYFTELAGGASGMGTVKQVSVAGGAVTTLATGQNNPTNLVTDGVSLYWTNTNSGQIMKMPIAGGVTPVTYVGGQGITSGLALFGNTVYWAGAGGVLMASPK